MRTTAAVQKAYKRARVSDFPEYVRSAYAAEESKHLDYAASLLEMKQEMKEMKDVLQGAARALLKSGLPDEEIAETCKMTLAEVIALKESQK